jgi:hypothetical protein
MEETTGCYMADNSGIYLLNNCSNYYNTGNNKKNCACSEELSDSLEKSKCDTPDECLKPYCIGKCQGSDSKQQCTTNKNKELYKCTKTNMDDPNFVKYFYYDNFFIGIVPYYGKVSENYRNLLSEKNVKSPKSNIYKYIVIVILILLILGLIAFLYSRFVKKSKMRF